MSTHTADAPIPYTLTSTGRAPLVVEQVVAGDTHRVQVDATTVVRDVARVLIEEIRRSTGEPGGLLFSLAAISGSTTPLTRGRPARIVDELVAAAQVRGAHLIDLPAGEAYRFADDLVDAATEPDPCARPSCNDYATHRGLCAIHDEGAGL